MFRKKKPSEDEPPPLPQLKKALYLEDEIEIEEELLLPTKRELLIEWFGKPAGCGFVLQTALVLALAVSGIVLITNYMFGAAYAQAGATPTTTHTPPPPLPTRTSLPSATLTKTPWPTSAPQGKGKAMADIFTSSYEGFDNRFGSRLMGTEPDFEEYLLCFDGTGVQRKLNGVTESGVWATWEDQDGFCMPAIFYSYSSASDILITSDVVHVLGLSEAVWKQISIHIYEYGAPDNYSINCPAGVVAQTSKFCLHDNGQ